MSTHASSTLAGDAPPSRTTVSEVATFVVQQLARHRKEHKGTGGRVPPLVVGVQGPQGSGKSYLASLLPTALSSPSHGSLRTATLSLDDLYLPHSSLRTIAASNPGNKLLDGRGQAGTHDLPLGLKVLRALKDGRAKHVSIPVFEKSLYGGEGDRLPKEHWITVQNPDEIDVVVLEGWMLGFRPVFSWSSSLTSLEQLYADAAAAPESGETKQKLGIDYAPPFLLQHELAHLQRVEEELEAYEELWKEVDVVAQIRPERMGYVWEWRLEQEHNMKAKNGGIGMTDEQVKTFISRYMPGYELFLRGLSSAPWTGGKGLAVVIGKGREILRTEEL